MATVGTFKKSGAEFLDQIVTLNVQTKNVRIVPEAIRPSGNAPSHRIYVGRAEVGAAWSKRSAEQRDNLSVKLDDPSSSAPIYANLVQDEDGEGFASSGPAAARPTPTESPCDAPPGTSGRGRRKSRPPADASFNSAHSQTHGRTTARSRSRIPCPGFRTAAHAKPHRTAPRRRSRFLSNTI